MIKNISSKNVTLEPSLFKNRAEHNFTRLEKSKAIWSPQYTMHKTLMGLLDAYRFADNQQALEIIKSQADWYVDWTQQMVKVNPAAIYSGEEGGMLEIWLTLYELTKDEKYMELAHQYDHPELSINGKQLSIESYFNL